MIVTLKLPRSRFEEGGGALLDPQFFSSHIIHAGNREYFAEWPAYFGKPFFIIEWKMAPNAYLPPHNHPNISVCTVCTDGEARIRNFQPEGATPEFASKDTFRVRETHDELLTPGRINNLSAVPDNIHTFKAGKNGARGFDITTYHGKDAGFSFLEVAAKPSPVNERIFDAVWVKR